MSYCRWSDLLEDGAFCDLYIYDGPGYISINVAFNRLDEPVDVPALDFSSNEALAVSSVRRRRWMSQHEATFKFVPIGLPYAGESAGFAEPEECVAFLRKLRSLGYRMPDNVLDPGIYEGHYGEDR